VRATLAPLRPAPGTGVTATITVRNGGRRTARDLTLVDVPSATADVRSAASPAGDCTVTARRARCPLARLAPGDVATVEVRLLVDREPASATLVQHVTLTSTGAGEVADRSLSTLIDRPGDGGDALLAVPGTTLRLIALVVFVLAARRSSARNAVRPDRGAPVGARR
jgi:hypothetical protein